MQGLARRIAFYLRRWRYKYLRRGREVERVTQDKLEIKMAFLVPSHPPGALCAAAGELDSRHGRVQRTYSLYPGNWVPRPATCLRSRPLGG